MIKRIFLFFTLLWCCTGIARAQGGIPFIRNFTATEYGAHNRNFDIACTKDNTVFVANFEGLLYYDHAEWQRWVCGLEGEPERGRRCEQCFVHRLTATALKACELGITWFATTLASSRWKSLEQINRAGLAAEQAVNVNDEHRCRFWPQNWRKGGLQERRNQLLKEYGFYNQLYCGCEYSMPHD